MSDTALLSIEHLKKAYGDNVVLEDISLSVKRGEVIVVIGPRGAASQPSCAASMPLSLFREAPSKLTAKR